jgi:hypothetical protein
MSAIAPRSPALMRWLLLPRHVLALATSEKSFRDNPVIGSPTLNRWGLAIRRKKVARLLGGWRRRQLAGRVAAADRADFARDGFIVKPDFLDPAIFARLRDEIIGLEVPAREAVIGDTLTRLIPLDARTLPAVPVTKSVVESRSYRSLLDYVGSFRRRPHVYVQTVFSRYCDGEPDVQSFFHSDTFHPTVKSWLFLDDVEADGTPFIYVPGSHLFNRRRFAWERRASITAGSGTDRLSAEGSLRISETELARLGYAAPKRFAVKANTLVIADTSGFHKRATTTRQTRRLAIWAYSRSNPFLPWVGGDLAALPGLKGRALRLYWRVTDWLKDLRGKRRDWRWVGTRSPLTPP